MSNIEKEIAEDHYYYARSCVRQNFFPGAEEMFIRILRNHLKKDIYDDPYQTTCTGMAYHAAIVPFQTAMTIVARQFSLMTEAGYENFVCSCVTSFGLYVEVMHIWQKFPETLEKTKIFLKKATGRSFELPKNIIHSSDIICKYRHILANQIKYKLINHKTLEPLNVVDHVGCHYAKIYKEHSIGGSEYPRVLSYLIETWGGNVVNYPEKRHCCGFGFRQYLIKDSRGYSYTHSLKKFESMKPYNVDLILTNCPGCNYFLDRWQYVAAVYENKFFGANNMPIPVLSFEELTALLLGYDPWLIGLQMHQVPVEPLLDKIGIPYSPKKKYFDTNPPKNPFAFILNL